MRRMLPRVARTPRIPQELTVRPFTLDEARTAGITLSALRGRSWQRIGARLYRWRDGSADPFALIEAVQRTLPASAVFVGRTAAWLHRLDVRPADPVQVAALGLESRAGVEVRHSDVSGETEELRAVRVTTLARTLLDLCAWSPEVEALGMIDMAVRMRLITADRLREYAHRRTGAARLRALADIAAPAESPMESRLRWLLLGSGLPKPEVQADLYDDSGRLLGRADLFYRSADLVIEYDGGNHRERLVSDDRRQNLIIGAGYRILRFTAVDLYQHPGAIVAQVRAAIGQHESLTKFSASW